MTCPLDIKYFENLATVIRDGYYYHIVRPKERPMILFAKDGTALAALHLRPQDTIRGARLVHSTTAQPQCLIAKKPLLSDVKADFYGVINEDNKDIEFVISNLSDNWINFNILKQDIKVSTVDIPSYGLNQVNELNKYQSYPVQSDQGTKRSLVLKAIETPDGKTTTIENAEKSSTPIGTYYHLAIVPQIGTPLVQKYKETIWACVDVFILRGQPYVDKVESIRRDVAETSTLYNTRGGNSHLNLMSSQNVHLEVNSGSLREIGRPISSLQSSASMQLPGELDEDGDCFGEEEDCDFEACSIPPKNDRTIKDSLASKIEQGRIVNVVTQDTGVEYDYDHHSVPTVICSSVNKNLVFIDTLDKSKLSNIGRDMLDDFVKNESKKMIEELTMVYKEKDCVICLEETPDCIYYQCGHNAVHIKCSVGLKICPLCRKHIHAVLKV